MLKTFVSISLIANFLYCANASALVENNIQNSETVSVLTFGAKGDGENDDAGALEKAINYCVKNKKKRYETDALANTAKSLANKK